MSADGNDKLASIDERLKLLEAKQILLEENFADLLEGAGIEETLSRADEWWYEHDQRRAKLGRKTQLGRLRL